MNNQANRKTSPCQKKKKEQMKTNFLLLTFTGIYPPPYLTYCAAPMTTRDVKGYTIDRAVFG